MTRQECAARRWARRGTSSRVAEILGPVETVGSAAVEADAGGVRGAVEDVGPVAGAVHPGVDNRLRGGLPGRDVLGAGLAVPLGLDPVPGRPAVRAVVLE